MTILASKVAKIKLGLINIEGLLFEDGKFGVAIQQVASLFQLPQNNIQRDVKALLGKDFSLVKTRTDRELVEKVRARSLENAVSLEQFEIVLLELTIKGNKKAIDLSRALTGLALTQLFSDSFGIKFDAEDRQKYLETRLAGKVTRRTLTDAIGNYIQTHEVSDNYRKFIYSNVSDCLNLALFGKKASKLCIERSCDKDSLRDTHDEAALARIDKIEAVAMIQIDNGMEPIEAMKFTLETVFRIAC